MSTELGEDMPSLPTGFKKGARLTGRKGPRRTSRGSPRQPASPAPLLSDHHSRGRRAWRRHPLGRGIASYEAVPPGLYWGRREAQAGGPRLVILRLTQKPTPDSLLRFFFLTGQAAVFPGSQFGSRAPASRGKKNQEEGES